MNIEEIKNRWSKATPGPWCTFSAFGTIQVASESGNMLDYGSWSVTARTIARYNNPSDAMAIAQAPSDIAYLISEIERLEKQQTTKGGL